QETCWSKEQRAWSRVWHSAAWSQTELETLRQSFPTPVKPEVLTANCEGGRMGIIAATVVASLLLAAALPSTPLADPPAWPPAHGWRDKHKHKAHDDDSVYIVQPYPYYVRPQPYAVPFGINIGSCNRDAVGAAIGGVAGGAIGAGVTDRDDRVVGIIAGTVI